MGARRRHAVARLIALSLASTLGGRAFVVLWA